jgi:hypothetical protein
MAARCDAPVEVANVFIGQATDTGHRCLRPSGHSGPHRWTPWWEQLSPAEVEAAVAADHDTWESDDDRTKDGAEPASE